MTRATTAVTLAALLASCGMPPHSAVPAGTKSAPEVVLEACTSQGGYQLNDRAAACQGTFTGTLDSQCRQGWSPCTRSPLAPQDCVSLPGFFAASRTASTSCQDAVNALLGCGTFGSASRACSAGFARRVPCGGAASGSPYSCSGSTVRNEDPKSGVLCCAARSP